MIDLDTPVQFRAPLGHWRVVEFLGSRSESTPRLRGIIGDYADWNEASDAVRGARHPHERVIYNDMGAWVMSISPGSEGAPNAGPES